MAVDLRAPDGRDVMVRARRADIVIEGGPLWRRNRLGRGDEALAALNARLIYASVSGFGQEGPHIGLRCTDSVAQACFGRPH